MMQVEDAEIASYELPDIFRYNGDNFIHLTVVYSGTGHSVTGSVFAIGSENTLAEVVFPNIVGVNVELKPGEGVWKGVSTKLSDDKLEFEYYIWNEGDQLLPDCRKCDGHFQDLQADQTRRNQPRAS
jgi:hypothetical protein